MQSQSTPEFQLLPSDMDAPSLLDAVLHAEQLTPVFQAIIAADGESIFGYEALIRGPKDTPLHSPLALFDVAASAGRLVELDFMCRRLSIQRFMKLGLPGRLFLNVMPESLIKRDFREGLTSEFLKAVGLAMDRVIIEITEHAPIHDYDLVGRAVRHYRKMGFKVALDDLGAGYSGLRHWSELRPDFVKIDRHFTQGVDREPSKQQFLQSILQVSRDLGCQVIAEGVETSGEYRTLMGLRCPYVQGYLFCHPTARPATVMNHVLPPSEALRPGCTGTAEQLCTYVEPFERRSLFREVAERFQKQPQLRCIPIVEDGKPIGVIRQQEFLRLLASPFSHSLYSLRPIHGLFNMDMIVVQENASLEQVSQIVTDAKEATQQDFVIVDEQQRYRGIGNIVDLLKAITDIQVRHARQANPLTGLPGNVPINDALNKRLEAGESFAAVYCDLDNFKAYNDYYGYWKGDEILLAVAELLQEHSSGKGEFVGHVGGDDFVMILQADTAEATCHSILKHFEATAPNFYTEEHRQQGGILAEDRRGEKIFYPITSLSLALQQVSKGSHQNALDIADSLSQLKAQAKQYPGNSLFVNRRQD